MLQTLKDLEKCTIGATDGHIDHVKDLYFDDHAGVIRYLIVDTGPWLASRKVLISPISIQKPNWATHTLPVAITRGQIEGSPNIDTDQPVSRQQEERYLGYYGYPNYWGGAGMWGGGMFPMAIYPGYTGLPVAEVKRGKAMDDAAKAVRERHRGDDPHLRSCKTVIGYQIQATDGRVGHVDGLLIDEETWAVRYLVVNTSNWWIWHKVLIAPQWIEGLNWSEKSVAVDLSRGMGQAAPPYDPSAELDQQRETDLYTHYGRLPHEKAGTTPEREI